MALLFTCSFPFLASIQSIIALLAGNLHCALKGPSGRLLCTANGHYAVHLNVLNGPVQFYCGVFIGGPDVIDAVFVAVMCSIGRRRLIRPHFAVCLPEVATWPP